MKETGRNRKKLEETKTGRNRKKQKETEINWKKRGGTGEEEKQEDIFFGMAFNIRYP